MIDISTFVEIEPLDRPQFLKVRETLTRIGIPSATGKVLYQICFILQKRGRYFIVHFKELRMLDGLIIEPYTEDDRARRNTVADLLDQWFDFVKLRNPEVTELKLEKPIREKLKVIHYGDKKEWTLRPKYEIGNRI